MMHKVFKLITGIDMPSKQPSHAHMAHQYTQRRNMLIQKEAAVGGRLFGAVPKGHYREFFCLDRYTWIWFEEWHESKQKTAHMIVRYEVQRSGILKSVNGNVAGYVEGKELDDLLRAMSQYYTQVSREVYGRQLATA